MRILVISDIHGSKYYAEKIPQICEKEKPDQIILLGDLYYNGPRNTLTEEYNPGEVVQILNSLKDKIRCTKGNCDSDVDEKVSDFEFEEYIEMNINGVDFFFSHGNKYNMDNVPPTGDVVIYGHLHTGFIQEEYGMIFANPGSISLPKGGTKNSYLVIDEKEIILKDIFGEVISRRKYIK